LRERERRSERERIGKYISQGERERKKRKREIDIECM